MPVVGLLGALFTFFARYLTVEILKMLAFKAMLLTFAIIILPAVIENFMVYLFDGFMGIASAQLQGQTFQGVITISGVFGWVATTLKIPEGLAILLSAVTTRYALNLIPFVNV